MKEKDEISILRNEIKELESRKATYENVNKQIDQTMDEFDRIKKDLTKVHEDMKDCFEGTEAKKKIEEFGNNIKEVKEINRILKEEKQNIEKEIKSLNAEKTKKTKRLNEEIEKEYKNKK